jgi:S-DNA-T family DNA segregation ATPase FtsK/SpoIIIE
MRTTTRSTPVERRGNEDQRASRLSDAGGVLLIAAALVLAIALALGNAGLVGQALGDFFRTLFGRGAWVVPVVLAAFGVSCLAGKRRHETSRVAWGVLLIFAAAVGVFARDLRGDYFDPEVVSASGGYLGAVLGWTFSSLFGAAKVVALGALGMIGAILCIDAPVRAIAAALASRVRRRPAIPVRKPGEPPNRAVVKMPEQGTEGSGSATGSPRTRRLPMTDRTRESVPPSVEATPKEGYNLPPVSLLALPPARPQRTVQEMQRAIQILEGTLEEFNIDANVVEIATGPTITRYEIQLGPGIRVGRITSLADNIAMNLAAEQVRVEAPIPGKAAIGVEVPNAQRSVVSLQEVCGAKEFLEHPSRLCVALGQDVGGQSRYADLATMPHLLIGGATNSGKSIGLATIIMSLLMRNTPKDVRLVMIDPKRVELSLFDGVPHLMCPVVRDVKEAPGVLRAVWHEMDLRFDKFAEAGVRNIDGWNSKASFQERLPYIVVIIDELADLMIQAAAEVETSIVRLAQLARAVGIHLVIATQRPSVDVITGTIKANIPSRIAFGASSHIDSRTILDQAGAERLVGRGDMLYLPIDENKPARIQGCYVSEAEIEAVCAHWKAQERPHYVLNPVAVAVADREAAMADEESDPLWEESVRWVVDRGQASTSMLQRRFAIGFQRASRLLDLMEERQIVGPRDGPRPREVLIDPMDVDALFGARRGYRAPPADTDPLE